MTSNESKIFIIDLDGTLLKTDSLGELFFQTLAQGRLASLFWPILGRAAFKKRLALATELDLADLPWNEDVIKLAQERRQNGQRIFLATAADEVLAQKIVAHFDFFEGYVASDGRRNLKGEAKANVLVTRFGAKGFAYAGNSLMDLPVWRVANEAVVVGDQSLVKRAKAENHNVLALGGVGSGPGLFRTIIKVIRVHQWAKNLLLFLPLMMAHLFTLAALNRASLAFLVFNALSSGGYILNDLLDLNADRRHPEKRARPMAAGTFDPLKGAGLFFLILLLGLLLAWFLGGFFFALALVYLLTSVIYSLKLKTIAILDVVVLTLLYCLRVLAGAIALDIVVSQWLLSFCFFVFASLCLIKRLGETVKSSDSIEDPASSRRPYGVEDKAFFLAMTSSCVGCAVL
ncbi:MAG: UbiA family prenyltransferase, partial [Deltaproteobacteria bacterium]|nr:UbiA family prenyltransferase [Deltaproteobacteria bacterium]